MPKKYPLEFKKQAIRRYEKGDRLSAKNCTYRKAPSILSLIHI